MRSRYFSLVLSLAILLSACSQQANIHFYPNEAWQVKITLTVDRGLLEIAAGIGGEAVSEMLGFPAPSEVMNLNNWLDVGLDLLVAQYTDQGIDATWRYSGNTYSLTARGRTHAQFMQLIPSAITLTPVEGTSDQYHLYIYIGDWSVTAAPLFQQTITLHTGKIISSNAPRVRGGTATWRNPIEIDVVFIPASPIPLACLWTAGGIVFVSAIVVLITRMRRQRCPMCGARANRKVEYCPNCNAVLS